MYMQNESKKPNKKYAILFDFIQGVSDASYLEAFSKELGFGSLVGGYASPNQHIFTIYASSEEEVKKFFQEHGSITVNGKRVIGRPTTSIAINLMIKNVNPIVPNDEIRKILDTKYKLPICSNVEFCHVSLGNVITFSFVTGTRRVRIVIDDKQEVVIPEKITGQYVDEDGDKHEIDSELQLDGKLACLKCKNFTHLASGCKRN